MNTRESLTVRTVTALRRLADLEERGKSFSGPKANVLNTALRELEAALEELRVASEQLNMMVDEMAQTRSGASRAEFRFNEFRNLLPLSCVLTDLGGCILDANAAAGELLNVAPRHLTGKPLSLYMVERDRFFEILNGVRASDNVRAELDVRPRERKARRVGLHLSYAPQDDQLYWFFQETAAQTGAV